MYNKCFYISSRKQNRNIRNDIKYGQVDKYAHMHVNSHIFQRIEV